MATAVTVGVLGVVGVRLMMAARFAWSAAGRRRTAVLLRGLRWDHFTPLPLVLVAVLGVAAALLLVPGLEWGWWSALGGDGNPAFGTTSATSGTLWEWLVPVVFIALLVPALGLFAEAEERIFRLGAQHWSWPRRVLKTLGFGLVHAVVGIPIGVALALSVGGAYFMARYLRCFHRTGDAGRAVTESTRAHLAYNLVILGLVVALAIAAPLLG